MIDRIVVLSMIALICAIGARVAWRTWVRP